MAVPLDAPLAILPRLNSGAPGAAPPRGRITVPDKGKEIYPAADGVSIGLLSSHDPRAWLASPGRSDTARLQVIAGHHAEDPGSPTSRSMTSSAGLIPGCANCGSALSGIFYTEDYEADPEQVYRRSKPRSGSREMPTRSPGRSGCRR
jgi:hypothetical protein